MMQNEKLNLAILFLISIALSTYLFFETHVISLDGAFQYIPMAKFFASGLFKDAIGFSGQQPLYSLFIALVSRLTSNFELAGILISSFFGVLVILPVYFLGKQISGLQIAFLSAFLLAIHPYIRRFSADVLKESTYLFFLATAIWFTLKTFQREKMVPYLFVPLFSVLPYLTRPDGVEVLLAVFFSIFFLIKFNMPEKKWIAIFFLLLSSAILFLPYLLYLKEATGEWTLSKTKDIVGFFGSGVATVDGSVMTKIFFSFKKLNLEILAVYHPFFIFLLVIGLLSRKFSNLKNEEKFLVFFFILHYIILFLLILNISNWNNSESLQEYLFSGRHVLPLLLVSIYWVGKGLVTLHHMICEKVNSYGLYHRLGSEKKSTLVWVTLVILILFIVLPKTLKPLRYEKLPEKWAGIWIKNQSRDETIIFTTVPRVAYYADRGYQYINLEKDKLDHVRASMTEKGGLYLVIRGRDIVDASKVWGSFEKKFIEVMRYEKEGMEKVIIYKRIS